MAPRERLRNRPMDVDELLGILRKQSRKPHMVVDPRAPYTTMPIPAPAVKPDKEVSDRSNRASVITIGVDINTGK